MGLAAVSKKSRLSLAAVGKKLQLSLAAVGKNCGTVSRSCPVVVP